jgi:hypothetical protein
MYVAVEDTKPWYKQFWPWALMVMPATAVVAGLYTYSLAASGSSGLVVDDYYKAGKAINRSLERGQKAAALGLQANVAFSGQSVRLLLDNPSVQPQDVLTLKLMHATIPNRDQVVSLRNSGAGMWTGQIEVLSAGKWHLHVLPADESWRLEGVMPSLETLTLVLQPAL